MELLTVIRQVASRRILMGIGLALAFALGARVGGFLPPGGGAAPGPAAGVALARVLIDTRAPLTATTTPDGADTIVQRSVLLAAEIGGDQTTRMIAARAGVQPDQLIVLGSTLAPVSVNSLLPDGPLPQMTAIATAGAVHTPDVVRLLPDYSAPTISILAAAPTPAKAAALAKATVEVMGQATASARSGRANANIELLAPVRSAAVPAVGSSHHILAVVAAVVVFAIWFTGIVLAGGLRRAWRRGATPATEAIG